MNERAESSKVVAAIDVGSSGIRMEIAEIRRDGSVLNLESLHRSVLLGNDTFDTGRLSTETTLAACEALRNFRLAMDEMGVIESRAVATSAVREADNSDNFIDRIFISTGFDLEIIEGAEQSRLTYSAVEHSLRGEVNFHEEAVALIEVGGGAVDVMLQERGDLLYTDTFGLGAVRVRQDLRHAGTSRQERNAFLRHLIQTSAQNIPRAIPLKDATVLIALGGDVRFLVRQIRSGKDLQRPYWSILREEFLEQCVRLADADMETLAGKHNLSFGDSVTLGPALMIYEQIVKATSVDRVIVSNANIRDGLLLDMAHKLSGKEESIHARETVASALGLAKKYNADLGHGQHVARLALLLFDAIQKNHGMGPRQRLLLEVAAILHEIGSFVHNRAHHKHTLYLISVSEIFGLSQRELAVVANVARYHRRSPPLSSHPQYMSLERHERATVCKLAAILRVADALDKDHQQKIKSPRFNARDGLLQILVPNDLDLLLEGIRLQEKGDLFQEIFGFKPVLAPVASTQ